MNRFGESPMPSETVGLLGEIVQNRTTQEPVRARLHGEDWIAQLVDPWIRLIGNY